MRRTLPNIFSILLLLVLGLASAQESPPGKDTDVPSKVEGKPVYTLSGTAFWDLKAGTGKKAIRGFTLTVNYTGWYKKGKKEYVIFDSTRGKSPYRFDLGRGNVIKGWDEGLVGMRVGGKRQLVIPPEAGYGANGSGKIPSNATLIFEVELVDVR